MGYPYAANKGLTRTAPPPYSESPLGHYVSRGIRWLIGHGYPEGELFEPSEGFRTLSKKEFPGFDPLPKVLFSGVSSAG